MPATGYFANAVINKATASNHEIVEGIADRTIRVHNYVLVADAGVDATWEDEDGVDLSGPLGLGANDDVTANSHIDCGCFDVPEGKGLHLLLSGAVQVSGHIRYQVIK